MNSDTVDMKNKTTKCMEMQKRARSRIPGMTQLLSKRPDMFAPGIWPGYYKKAKGAEIWDLDGNRYLDMSISGIGANVLGYADPDVDSAVIKAIEKGSSSSLNSPEEIDLADLLCDIHPWADQVRFSRTGGEAVAIAVRIARASTCRDVVAFCGYHGWHDWYLSANLGTENALGEHLLAGLKPAGVPRGLTGTALPFRYNHLDELKEIVSTTGNKLAAIVMEPIRNDWPKQSFLNGVREIADKNGSVLIVDEISAGFRMNSGGAHLKIALDPDIAVFSKALGNGYPIGAVIGKRSFMDAAQSTFISSTNWTERVGFVAALETIKKHIALDVGSHLMKIGQSVQKCWQMLAIRHNIEIRVTGIPPLSHFEFITEKPMATKALFVRLMLERGILASNSFYSMLAHNDEHLDRYNRACDEVFAEIATIIAEGRLDSSVPEGPASSGFARLA